MGEEENQGPKKCSGDLFIIFHYFFTIFWIGIVETPIVLTIFSFFAREPENQIFRPSIFSLFFHYCLNRYCGDTLSFDYFFTIFSGG